MWEKDRNKFSFAALAAASLLVIGSSASALGLKPGNYEVDGSQQICLVAGGTWYGETFPSWGGDWRVGPVGGGGDLGDTFIWGNYASGAGNDSMVVSGTKVAWTEWRDDESFTNVLFGSFVLIKSGSKPAPCTAPDAPVGGAAPRAPGHENPQQ